MKFALKSIEFNKTMQTSQSTSVLPYRRTWRASSKSFQIKSQNSENITLRKNQLSDAPDECEFLSSKVTKDNLNLKISQKSGKLETSSVSVLASKINKLTEKKEVLKVFRSSLF